MVSKKAAKATDARAKSRSERKRKPGAKVRGKGKAKGAMKVIRGRGRLPLEVTDVAVKRVEKELDDGTNLLAEVSVTFNGVLHVRGFWVVKSHGDASGELEAAISPPVAVDPSDESFEVIRFLDSDDPERSPMWNQVMNRIASAFALQFGLERQP